MSAADKGPAFRFVDSFFWREDRYSLGVEEVTGRAYLAIPVSIGVVDYEEYYGITPEQSAQFLADPRAAATFADECRRHRHDDLLLQQPGANRGTPV